jgi:hypothetical protein
MVIVVENQSFRDEIVDNLSINLVVLAMDVLWVSCLTTLYTELLTGRGMKLKIQ